MVQIALDLPAWMPMLALAGQARRQEPRRLRLRLFSAAARLVTTGRRILCLAHHWPWTDDVITSPFERLRALPPTCPPAEISAQNELKGSADKLTCRIEASPADADLTAASNACFDPVGRISLIG